jgi:mRNA interferase RelE/StbE
MAYRIEISPSAARQVRKLSRRALARITDKVDALADDPRPEGAKKLIGTNEYLYRIRTGDYWIIHQVRDEVLIVLVVHVGHRKDVYRRL